MAVVSRGLSVLSAGLVYCTGQYLPCQGSTALHIRVSMRHDSCITAVLGEFVMYGAPLAFECNFCTTSEPTLLQKPLDAAWLSTPSKLQPP